MAGVNIQTFSTHKERLRDWWDLLMRRSSPECREMIHERLKEHDEAIRNNTKSPDFDLQQGQPGKP